MEQVKTLPSSEESEQIVLAAIMTEKNALNEIRQMLDVKAFYFEKHREIYSAACDIGGRGDFPDIITVMDELRKKNSSVTPFELTKLSGMSTPFYMQHAAIVFDKYNRRRFFEIGAYLQNNCFSEENDIVDVVDEAKRQIDEVFPENGEDVYTLEDAIRGVYENINRNMRGDGYLTGYPMGFKEFDRRSGGLQTSDLIVVAADTSTGKTSLAIKIAMNCGCPVAFYSMEMKKEQIAARMISIETGIPANEILYSRILSDKILKIDKGVSRICKKPVFFDDRSNSGIDSILRSIHSLKSRYGIKGAIIDYLQILNVNMKGTNKEQQMANVARLLKNTAKDLDIWIIALSQLNRDKDNPVPSLARLRDSGQIAEAADTVIMIYRPEIYGKNYPDPFQGYSTNGTAMIDVAKGRNIGLLKFIAGFDKATTNFYELGDIPLKEPEDEPF